MIQKISKLVDPNASVYDSIDKVKKRSYISSKARRY